MKINFVGGVDRVGSLGMLVESMGERVLFDYGMTPSKPPSYPIKTPLVNTLYVTHSHLDHVGCAPWLSGEYGTEMRGTELTLEVAVILLEDSLKISRLEGYPIPFDHSDLRRFTEESEFIRYRHAHQSGPLSITPYNAGHIPGSAMYKFSEGGSEILFTGDINSVDTRLQLAPEPVPCDVLVMESTYSGRPHPPRDETEKAFLDKVREVLDRGGHVIVPAFAVGRTQEVAMILSEVHVEKWLDGMGRRVANLYLRHGEFLRSARKLKKALRQFNFVKTPFQRKKAAQAPIVVTTSGMLDGGPVLEYIKRVKDDPKSAILLTGYQVEDTNGRMLMETGTIDLAGVLEKVSCEVCHYDFSAHAGHEGLVGFAEGCSPEEILLVHGDDRDPLKEDLESVAEVHTPTSSDTFEF
jgi:putative mRNA 3-end processing factor